MTQICQIGRYDNYTVLPNMEYIHDCIKILKHFGPPDVFGTDYTHGAVPTTPSLNISSPIFCDNIILWSIGKDDRVYIYNQCIRWFHSSFQLKQIRNDTLKSSDIAPKGTEYYTYKVSLSDVQLGRVIESLEDIPCNNIILHDIDITQDIPYITTREIVKEYVLRHDILEKDIVDDRRKVGENCISFYNQDHSLRIKVYNKFVQMLESCDVMTVLGSRIHSMFIDPSKHTKRILTTMRKTGITRIEVKFYGDKIYPLSDYVNNFSMVKETFQECKFYSVSLEDQWKKLVESIHNKKVLMMHLEYENLFVYCHWWNSQTGKMQGGIQKGVNNDTVKQLVSNYSFNGMITKFIIVNEDDVVIEDYKRTTKNVTLVPGPKRSLYPQMKNLLSPEEVGIVDHLGIRIGWVNTQIRKTSPPLSQIRKVRMSDDLEEVEDLMTSHYRAGYSVLNTDTLYQLVAKSSRYYRNSKCTLVEVKDEDNNILKVRCGRMLEELLKNVNSRVNLRTENVTTRNGIKDIVVSIVS
jgi:hypothetical protein